MTDAPGALPPSAAADPASARAADRRDMRFKRAMLDVARAAQRAESDARRHARGQSSAMRAIDQMERFE